MMSCRTRAEELCEEWFPSSSPSSAVQVLRETFIDQMAAEFAHVRQQGYSAGYNACLRENLAVKPVQPPSLPQITEEKEAAVA